jgi:methylmalonyl-CoA/ethylmalonyl-CoA epimerase
MFSRVDHIGIVVADLQEAGRWLGETFGLPLNRTLEFPDRGIRAAFYRCGDVDIEVIEITDPEARRQRLGEGERARIEHIAVEVGNLEAALVPLAALGVRTTTPEPRRIGDSLHMWTVADSTGGVSYQLIERGPESRRAGAGGPE